MNRPTILFRYVVFNYWGTSRQFVAEAIAGTRSQEPRGTEVAGRKQRKSKFAGLISEQLKTSQEQMLLDNANVAEQIKAIQDQLARVISKASKQNAPPRIAAAPSPPTAAVARKPVPALSSPQATAQPKAEKPKLSSTSRPPAPAR